MKCGSALGLDDAFQMVIDFSSDLQCVPEGRGTNRENHEFLHGELVASVTSTVDDIESRNGKNHLATGKVGDVAIKWHTLGSSSSFADGKRDSKDGVGTQAALVIRAVKLDQGIIDGLLVEGVEPDDSRSKNSVDVVDGIQDTFAQVASLIAIAKFNGFVDAGRGATGHCSTEKAVLGGEVDFDGGVAAAVENFAGFD